LPERADAALNGVLTAFEGVKESFGDCSFFGFIPGDFIDIVDADEPVAELEEGVTEDLLGIEGSGLDELADEVRALPLVRWHCRDSIGLLRNDRRLDPDKETELCRCLLQSQRTRYPSSMSTRLICPPTENSRF